VVNRGLHRRGSLLREVNENIRAIATRLGPKGSSWRFLCECGRLGCRETVDTTLDGYAYATSRGLLVADAHRSRQAA
jgi:hypothetical protein